MICFLHYDDLDISEMKFGLWMALHHPKDELLWGLGYSFGILKRGFVRRKDTQ